MSHRAVPAPLLTHRALLTGTIHHGYGWGCQGLPVHPRHLRTESDYSARSLALLAVPALLLVLWADSISLGFVAEGLLPGVWL